MRVWFWLLGFSGVAVFGPLSSSVFVFPAFSCVLASPLALGKLQLPVVWRRFVSGLLVLFTTQREEVGSTSRGLFSRLGLASLSRMGVLGFPYSG